MASNPLFYQLLLVVLVVTCLLIHVGGPTTHLVRLNRPWNPTRADAKL
jgi:hypothetical protein